jgi:hypothetical protein
MPGPGRTKLDPMALSSDTLKSELQKVLDPAASSFARPASVDEAREKWAAAFHTYVSAMVVVAPPTVAPANSSATFGGVKEAFKGQLTFATGLVPATPAAEIASAWAAGINAITLVPGATYAAPASVVISSITPFAGVADNQSALQTALQALFAAPSADGASRAGKIADAIHTSTTATVVTTCAFATVPPGGGTGPLTFG